MPEYPWPDWMKSSIDQRFNELARIASLLDEVKSIRQKQSEVDARLKQEYSYNSMNRRSEMKALAEEIDGVTCLDGNSITIDGITYG